MCHRVNLKLQTFDIPDFLEEMCLWDYWEVFFLELPQIKSYQKEERKYGRKKANVTMSKKMTNILRKDFDMMMKCFVEPTKDTKNNIQMQKHDIVNMGGIYPTMINRTQTIPTWRIHFMH
jgi:hypothetical protein